MDHIFQEADPIFAPGFSGIFTNYAAEISDVFDAEVIARLILRSGEMHLITFCLMHLLQNVQPEMISKVIAALPIEFKKQFYGCDLNSEQVGLLWVIKNDLPYLCKSRPDEELLARTKALLEGLGVEVICHIIESYPNGYDKSALRKAVGNAGVKLPNSTETGDTYAAGSGRVFATASADTTGSPGQQTTHSDSTYSS